MAIYQISGDRFEVVPTTTFAAAGVRERQDLQRFLRDNIDAVAPGTLVIAEEFGEWDESRRRIDLLAVDSDANLVVIELKRTEDGGHMELQAIRYAAMVSTLTFSRAVEVFAAYLEARGDDRDPEQTLLDFLGWESDEDGEFASDVRIVLASAEFSKELTSSVLWLTGRGVDIRCVRIRPYGDAGRVLLDVQQLIPLPEAEEFQVRIREKQSEERASRRSRRTAPKFRVVVKGKVYDALPRNQAILRLIQGLCQAGVDPEEIAAVITWRTKNDTLFRSADGDLDPDAFVAALTHRATATPSSLASGS
ncbi:hypothetical protein [Botrimarina sp.]|uniref:hypothetical protein n=1 Tax=Botrimarina sp. TaxID=2795802 RepID=UPI0032F046AE